MCVIAVGLRQPKSEVGQVDVIKVVLSNVHPQERTWSDAWLNANSPLKLHYLR